MVSYNDGSSNAPDGTTQFPNLLSNYNVKPPWAVAGVDYYAGTPSGTALKDPSTIAMAGVSVDAKNHSVNITGSNVVLSGYDFSKAGGWQVYVDRGATNLTLENSYFKVGSNDLMPIQAYYGGSVNLLRNTFDGGGAGSSANAMFFAGAGATVEYNRFTNVPNDAIDITNNGKYTIKYNVFDNLNVGTDYHSDGIQTYFSDIDSLDVEYNTLYQPASIKASMNAFLRIGDERGHTVSNPIAAYNTIVAQGGASSMANVFDISAGDGVAGSRVLNPTVHDNFIDPTGVQYAVYSPYLGQATNPTIYNNANLTGNPSLLLVGKYNSHTSGLPAAPPNVPVVTGAKAQGDQVVLTGTGPAGDTIDVFGPGGLLGATTTGSNGSWSLTTGQLPAGTDGFTARATDSLGNTSAASALVTMGGASPPPPTVPPPTVPPPTIPPPTIPPPTVPPPTAVSVKLAHDSGSSSSDGVTSDPALVGSGKPNAVVHFTIDGKAVSGTARTDGKGDWSFSPPNLADGRHTIQVVVDGNPTGTSLSYTLDTSAPAMSIALADDTGRRADDRVTSNDALVGAGDPGAVIHFVIDGKAIATTTTADSKGAWSFDPDVRRGSHTIVASETDIAGNTGSADLSYQLRARSRRPSKDGPSDASWPPSHTGNSQSDPNSFVSSDVVGKAAASAGLGGSSAEWAYDPVGLAHGNAHPTMLGVDDWSQPGSMTSAHELITG